MIALDYAERTGLHVRVGLIYEGPNVPDDAELESAARDAVPGLGPCWDVNHTGAGTAELSFEADE